MANVDAAPALTWFLEDTAMILLCLAAGACQAAGTLALIYYSTTEFPRKRASMTRATGGKERRAGKRNRPELVDSRVPSVLSREETAELFETMGRGLEQTEGVRLLLAALRATSEELCRLTSQDS